MYIQETKGKYYQIWSILVLVPQAQYGREIYGMYMNHSSKNHDDLNEEKQIKREALKMGRSHRARDGESSNLIV